MIIRYSFEFNIVKFIHVDLRYLYSMIRYSICILMPALFSILDFQLKNYKIVYFKSFELGENFALCLQVFIINVVYSIKFNYTIVNLTRGDLEIFLFNC